jgi:hypothetical protein
MLTTAELPSLPTTASSAVYECPSAAGRVAGV